MEIEYDGILGGRPYIYKNSFEEFAQGNILYYVMYDNKLPLEDQPKAVARALGRLLRVLHEKGLLEEKDVFEVIDPGYGLNPRIVEGP